jgi:hypothetical protein
LQKEPYDRVEKLEDLKEIKIYKWKNKCWKCKKETPRVSYAFSYFYDYHIGEIEKLDKVLIQEYPFITKIYSNTRREMVIANECIHCGALQGNWFIMEEILELVYTDMEKLIDKKIPNMLSEEDFDIEDDFDFDE